MKKCYRFAGIDLAIHIPDPWMYTEDRFLAPFQVERVEEPYVFHFEKVADLLPPTGRYLTNADALRVFDDGVRYIGSVAEDWENAYAQVIPNGRHHRVLLKENMFPDQLGAKTVLNCIGAEHLVAQNHGFVFHSSYIEVGGKAILFTAPSGTGKSTQADLWQRHRGARILNGDRSAVRFVDGQALACGIPFAGSSQICENVTLPLGAIVYLKQAPQNTIRRLRGAEAFRRVWEGVSVNTWDRDDLDRVSETVTRVLSAVPVLEFACTPDESAILTLEGALSL